MKLIRTSQSCDVEVEIHPDGNSFSYTVRSIEEGGLPKVWANKANAVETYKILSELHSGNDVRLPAKFVIEFANYALAELVALVKTTSTSALNATVAFTNEGN